MLDVRRLQLGDAEAWVSLRIEGLDAHPLAFGASPPPDRSLLVETIRTRLASTEDNVVFGAFEQAALVGAVGVRRYEGLKERHKALIWGMYVAERSRRSGVGEKLLHSAIEHARTWDGIEQVHLAVSEVASAAQRLYARNGFKAWGREPRALCWEGRSADETHMVLQF